MGDKGHGVSWGEGRGRVSQPVSENGVNIAAPLAMIWNQRVTFSAVTGSAATADH